MQYMQSCSSSCNSSSAHLSSAQCTLLHYTAYTALTLPRMPGPLASLGVDIADCPYSRKGGPRQSTAFANSAKYKSQRLNQDSAEVSFSYVDMSECQSSLEQHVQCIQCIAVVYSSVLQCIVVLYTLYYCIVQYSVVQYAVVCSA